VYSDWFAGSKLAYTVASVKRKAATLYAYRSNGTVAWHHSIAPSIVTTGWPHVVDDAGLYVGIMKPWKGIEALDPVTGHLLWRKAIPDVQRLALANGLLFALTFNLGQPVRVVVMRAKDGASVGAIVLPPGYYGFPEPNGLMVADGMVFIRAVGPRGSELIALGL
jgi:outer membrane protein assembly factor BamB